MDDTTFSKLPEIARTVSRLRLLTQQLDSHLTSLAIGGENGIAAYVARIAVQLDQDIAALDRAVRTAQDSQAPVAARESFDFGVGCELNCYEAAIVLVIGQLVMSAAETPEHHAVMFRNVVECLRKYGAQQARLAIERMKS